MFNHSEVKYNRFITYSMIRQKKVYSVFKCIFKFFTCALIFNSEGSSFFLVIVCLEKLKIVQTQIKKSDSIIKKSKRLQK